MSDVLLRDRRGAVEVLTLNRPEKRNALNRELLEALSAAFTELETDDDVRAIVLTAAGDRAFSAGMDLAEFASGEGGGQTVAEGPVPDLVVVLGEDDEALRRHVVGGRAEPLLAHPAPAAGVEEGPAQAGRQVGHPPVVGVVAVAVVGEEDAIFVTIGAPQAGLEDVEFVPDYWSD